MYAEKNIWCTQKAMAALFDVGVPAISKHLANVFESGELKEEATVSKMETVQQEGKSGTVNGNAPFFRANPASRFFLHRKEYLFE
jgi:hypothetical protein